MAPVMAEKGPRDKNKRGGGQESAAADAGKEAERGFKRLRVHL